MTFRGLWLVFALTGCNGGGEAPPGEPPLVFDTDLRASYTMVRPCRFPGEHSALNGFTVWVNQKGAASFAAIWQTPPGVSELAPGSVVVKELYSGQGCDPKTAERWVAMEKRSGFDPAHGDWFWQEVSSDRKVTVNGADEHCFDCHTGSQSCDGYGLAAGRDYLCTVP